MKTKLRLALLNLSTIVILVFLFISQSAGQNTDFLTLSKESRHFTFYSTSEDIDILDSLAAILEKNYARITDHLGIQIDKRIQVKVFPNINAFHAAIGYSNAPEWMVGTCIDDELMMVSPRNPGSMHTYESLMQVVVHEFVHIAVYYAIGDKAVTRLPKWLSEGYAQYEAGQINDHIRKSVKSGFSEKDPPSWSQLDSASYIEFGNMNGYGLSVTIVEFLIGSYGFEKMSLLIREPENIETIFGLSKETLENQWIWHFKHEKIK